MKKKAKSDRFYRVVYRFFYPLFRLVGFFRLGLRGKAKTYKEPILVLSNHTTDLDFLAVATHIKNHLYFVCSRHILARGYGRAFYRLFNPIAVFKGSVKGSEMLDLLRRIRRGNSVLLFCEGRLSHNGKTQPIGIAVAQLAKAAKCRVVTFRTTGGFFLEPRWQTKINPGKYFSHGIVNEYSPEDIAALSDEDLLGKIRADLDTDAYEEQRRLMKPLKFPFGVGDILHYYSVCPACHALGTLRSTPDDRMSLTCSACGYVLRQNRYGFWEGKGEYITTVADWEALQTDVFTKRFNAGYFFSDPIVRLCEANENFHETERAVDTLRSNARGLSIGILEFPFAEMEGLEVLKGGSQLVFSCHGKNYTLYKEDANLAKYLTLYEWAKKSK